MYNSILIVDDSLTQTKKDVIYALKKTNVLILEFDYASKSYEDLKTELNDIYQEREVLGDDLELQNILFLNTKFEHTNVFQCYLNDTKGFLLNIQVNDPNYNSWSKLIDLINYCKSSFSLENFDILDINHLYYSETWRPVFQHIYSQCDLSNSFMKLNYLSKSIIIDETNTNTLNSSNNWLKTLLNEFYDLNEDISNLMNLYFTKTNETSNNLLNSSTVFNIESNATKCNNYSLNSYVSRKIRILIIPCLQQNNNEKFALLINQLNNSSQNELLPIFLNDDESFESFSQKFLTLYNSFVSNIDTLNEYEIFMGIYLPPYWNDQPNPSNVISLSNNLQTISLELNNNQPSSGSIFSGIIQLIQTQYTYVSKLYFEFFNLTQNYSNNLNIIYKNLSTQEGFAGFVGFYFSYVTHLDNYHNIYKPELDNVEVYNPYVNNMIYYDSGTTSYYYEESKHNIEYLLNLENSANFNTHDFIEDVKIHNIILYNEELAEYLDEIQESLTPNTLLLKFSPDTTSYESMKQQLLSLNEETNVNIKNVALFQHSQEDSEQFIFLEDEDHTFYDVSNSDPELNTWSKFIDFTLFLQNDLHVSNFDLLMCEIYSNSNWVYILNKIESQLTSLNIRSSDDNTGHVMFDGDWVLESENVDVNMIYLYFNEKVLDVELVLVTGKTTIVMDNVNHKLYGAGQPNSNTLGPGGVSRDHFQEIPLPTVSSNIETNSGTPFASDEYIITHSISEKAHVIVTNKNRIFAIGANYGNMFTDDYTLNATYSKWIELDTTFVGNANIIKIDVAATTVNVRGPHTMVLLDNGKLYGCGYSWWTRNGNYNYFFPSSSQTTGSFTEVSLPANETKVIDFYEITIYRNTTIKTDNGVVYQLTGTSVSDWEVYIPSSIFNSGETVVNKHILHNHLITSEGRFFFKGTNSHHRSGSEGEIALDAEVTSWTLINLPNKVPYQYSSNEYPIDIYETTGAVLMLTNYNNLYTVGHNASGMRGIGSTSTTAATKQNWVRITQDNNGNSLVGKVIKIHGAYKSSFIITSDGYVLGAGKNDRGGRLGINRAVNSDITRFERGRNSSNQDLTVFTNFKGELLESSGSGSSSYNIQVISTFNSATDASSNTVLHFDSDSSYSDVSYALTTGIYKITNVPSNTPLALINNGQTDHIVYGGTTTESNSYGPNNSNYYNYVSGTMYIEVDSSFDPIGFYTTANGGSYLGTQGDLTYSAETIEYSNITTDSTSATTNILASSSYFNIFKDTSSNYFGILSDNNEISGNVYDNYKFINYNTYQITNIPQQYKLAIVELSSNDVTITGDNSKKSSHNIDGVSHDFYYGDISINASYGFNTLKMYVYNGLKSSINELQNNITFELPNVSLVQSEASRKVLTKDVFLKVYKNSATELLVHFNENDELSGNFYDTYSIEDPGIYKFKSIPSRYLFGIKVNSDASSIEISGNDSNKSTYSAGGGNVDFYHGDLYVKFNDLSYNISAYVYDTTTSTSVRVGSDSNEFIDFGNLGISGPTPVFMTLNVSEYFDTYGGFNVINIDPSFSLQPYDVNRDFGVYKNQTYVINAPTTYPLAVVGRLDQSDISYSGYSENQDGTTNIGGTAYPLYHGPVFFTINDDLSANNTLSFYTKNQYNLNTAGSIIYDASSEFSLDFSTNNYIENEDTYNIEMMNKGIVSETITSYTLNSGTRGHNANITHRTTTNLTIEYNNQSGLYIGSPHTGGGGKQYSQYFNSFVFMNSAQAGTWNFGLRTSGNDFASVYVLEGNYSWNSNMTYNSDTTSIITSSSPWTGTRYSDGVSYLSISDFLSYVDTNYSDANITKIIEIPQSTTTQVNGQYTFEANKPYSFLIYWRHNNNTYGTSNTVIRFGAWKQGTSASTLPASGVGSSNQYTSGDEVPEFFYNSINLSSTTTQGSSSSHLLSRFVSPNKINKNTTFHKNEKLVVYKNGIYNINQIPPWYPITILNNGITDKITLSGNANKKITQDVSGTSYDFYYGDISFSVLDSISDLSGVTLYSSYGGGTQVNNEFSIIMKEDSSLNEPLQQIMTMKIYTNGNGDPIYQLNDKSAILSNYKFGAYVGTYIIRDVPEAYSMAVINNDISDVITYSGTSTKGNYDGPDSIQYPFYYGTITMTIKSLDGIDGSNISLYSYNNGYMGAQDILEISNNQVYNIMDRDLDVSNYNISLLGSATSYQNIDVSMTKYTYFTEKLPTSTTSSTYTDSSGSKSIMLNGETTYDANKLYSVYDGTYTITASSANAFAIINIDSSGTHPLVITGGTVETTKNSFYNTEISYNYYSGSVTFKVLGYFNNVVLIEHIDGSSNSQYTRIKYDETANSNIYTENGESGGGGSTITTECLDISSSLSVADGYYILNGNTSYDSNKQFGIYIGSYEINNVPASHPLAILNNDASNNVTYSGTTLQGNQAVDGVTYNYYSGTIILNIEDDFTSDLSALSLHCLNHGYMGGQNKIVYSADCSNETPGYYIECLDISNSLNIVNSGGNKLVLNNGSSYESNRRFGVSIGDYEIHNVSSSHPIAFLNNDISDIVTYDGSFVSTDTVGGISYNFYSGTVRLIIEQDYTSTLSALSYYCGNHGYMGGQDKIIFSNLCDGKTTGYYIECLDASNNVNVISSGGNKYVFNNGSAYETNRRFGLTSGTYYLNNISTSHPMAILNNDISNVVTYTGSNASTQEVGGVTYNFYSGTITLTISGEFSGSLSAYCSNHGYMGTQDKFVYSHLCVGKSGSAPTQEQQQEQQQPLNKTCLRTNTSISIPASISSTNGIILNYGYVNVYDSTLLYGLDIGSYLITDIPAETPMAIFNYDVSSSVEYTGETLQLNMFNPNQSRYYNYYSGYVRLTIKSVPSDVSYVSYGIFKNKEFYDETNKFIFDTTCSTDDYYYDCVNTHSSIELSGNVIHVNKTSYETGSKKLALYNGYVEFRHVPEANPIAFISASNSNDISYQGLAYNKQTLTINSQNVDFYHGNVVLRILNDFENDLVLHMKQSGTNTTSTLNLYYSDYCDYKASSNSLLPFVECLTFDNCMNFTNLSNHRQIGFNLDINNIVSTQRIYGFNVGLYKFSNIAEENAIRITNISNGDVFLSSDDVLETQGINDISENNYYYGDVFLHVTTDVSYLSVGNSNGIEFESQTYKKFNGKDRLFYSTECLTDDSFYINCLKQTSDISVNNGKLILNDETSYSSTTKYGLYLGNYVINNISSSHPLALLNNDISNLVTYGGSTLESTTNVDGVPYNFYSGTMYITVKGDFNTIEPSGLSLYCSNHGYMGGENIFKYSELCNTIGEGYYIEDLSNTITFNKVGDKILLNNETTYDEYKKYGLYVGTYTISNVPEEDALAITNKDFLSKIAYTGTQLKGKASIGDVSYSFYYGTVSLYVFEPFDGAKNVYPPLVELSFYSYTNGYLGGLEKLVYYDIHRNYSTLNYTICLNEESIIKIFNVDNSDNYTFNNSASYYDYKQYGMHIGKYILKDVPMSEPIALLNQDVSNVIIYNGKSNKKVVANDPSGNSRDFFFGNVEIEVTGDFGNLSVYSANGKYLGGENILTFTDFCETNGFVIECLELESSMNIYNNNFTLNNASFYNEFKKYGLTKGSYRITNIPSSQALTFINNDVSNTVIITGDSIDLCGNFAGPDGNNYNFYTNELNITIKDEFTGFLPLYSYSDSSHNNGAELFVYSDLCTSINSPQTFTHCLNNENTNDISLASNDSTKLLLDSGLVNHNSSLKYGVFTGNYIFDVPSTHPIAFLNVDVSNHVSYFGNEENKSLGSAPRGNENIEYEFYHGRVILNIFGNFNTLSYYIKDDNDPSGGSYMGGLNAIKYSDFCDDQQSTTGVECLTTTSSFNLIENGSSYVYTLNGASSIVTNRNYGVHENIYTLTDICENYPIAILNNGLEEKISYGGNDADLCGNFTAPDGNNYDFYKNQIIFSVSDSSFNNLSFYVYNPPNSGYFGLQNKLIYSDLCEDTLAETDEVVEDILTTSFDQQAS